METYCTEGIILHALKFKDYDQILTVFTASKGIIKLIFKGALSSKNGKGALTAPLSHAEFIYSKKSSDLYFCKEITPIEQNLSLRKNISSLEAAFELIQIIHESQMPLKPAASLYNLLLHYLRKLAEVQNPKALTLSFRLKTLRYEGLLNLDLACPICNSKNGDLFFFRGECFCKTHAPPFAIDFSQDEIAYMIILAWGKQLSQIVSIVPSIDFQHKITLLYRDLIKLGP